MMTHKKNCSHSLKNSGQEYFHDPEWVDFKSWLVIPHIEGRGLKEFRRNEIDLYLNYFPEATPNHQVIIHSGISLINNSDFSIVNIYIFSKEAKRIIFNWHELSPQKTLQLKLIKKGHFCIYYSFSHSQKVEKRHIKIISKCNESLKGPHNFHSI